MDVNDDGIEDLLYAYCLPEPGQLLLGGPGNTFTFERELELAPQFLVGDLNGDGATDIFSGSPVSTYYLGDGAGGFDEPRRIFVAGCGTRTPFGFRWLRDGAGGRLMAAGNEPLGFCDVPSSCFAR